MAVYTRINKKDISYINKKFEIEKFNTIGLSSGASAPEIIVKNFINALKNKFSISINEVEIIKENVIFKVPNKLN